MMPNSDLINKKWKIPTDVVKHLKNTINRFSDKSMEGYTSLLNYVKEGYLTYKDLYNLKERFEKCLKLKDEGMFNQYGGKIMYNWLNSSLERSKSNVEKAKRQKKDLGEKNAYIKPHEKNAYANPTSFNIAKLQNNGEIKYENINKIKILLKEEHIKLIKNANR